MPLKLLLYISLTCYFLSLGYAASSQDVVPLVTGEFKDMKAEKFLLQLEKQTGFHFYYDTTQLTSVIINISVNKQSLPEVLKLAFVNTIVGFSHDEQNNVFISKGQVVHTGLPEGFFAKDTNNKKYTSPDSNISITRILGNKVQNTTEQNKLYSIGEQSSSNNQSGNTITGFILDNKTGEPVIGASVRVDNTG